ncbi:MAG: hydrogenase expression/formation C-terminal domain-containing protein [Thiogranum sp.]
MSGLRSIPVEVETSPQGAPAISIAPSILNQITAMLETLISSGQASNIDLQREPLSPQDHAKLRDMLGHGELAAELDCLGPTQIMETGVSGVWWVTHYREDRRVVGEFIEVTTCPDMLVTSAQELASGLSRLRSRLSIDAHARNPADIARRVEALGLKPKEGSKHDPKINQQVKRGNGDAE